MPIKVFGSRSGNTENKIDTNSFVQEPYFKTICNESNFEEDIDMENYFDKNLLTPIDPHQATRKSDVDKKFKNPGLVENTGLGNFTNQNLDNVSFVKVASYPSIGEHPSAKYNVDKAIYNSVDESSLLSLEPIEKLKLADQDSGILNSHLTSPKRIDEVSTKDYVDSLSESNRNGRDMPTMVKDQAMDVNKIRSTKLDSTTVNMIQR